ncbi:MAG: succinate-semialdehyde dehydrogenase [Alphaproteobacteria bacterium]|nr:succinate-semialdehyde dehydrogenase [Alphaproteobacteria bacterium]
MGAAIRSEAFINGQWIDAATRFDVQNPANGDTVAAVPDLGAAETDAAIAAAHTAGPGWSGLLAQERARILEAWYGLIIGEADRLAALMTAEGGKPLAEAKGEIVYAASFIKWFAEEGRRAYGRTIPTTVATRRYVTIRQPVGVVAAITPWNFPAAMITRKAGPALAAGCTMVLKPPQQTPLTALALAELGVEAGLPAGVLNIVTTSKSRPVGDALCADPRVRKLSFTGSTAVGKMLAEKCAGTVKRISLELGGNAPLIVFADADLDLAVKGAIASKFRNAGQTCVCANRILVQADIYDEFAKRLTDATAALKVGPGDEAGVQIGPLIDDAAIAKVSELVADARANGAKALTGGAKLDLGARFYAPTVLANVTRDMRLFREEIFGPVAPLVKFNDDDEAVSLANDTEYGLAGYFFTRDVNRAWKITERLDYGMVGVNDGILSNEVSPFGGVKESGLGREGGVEGLEEFLETKFINFGGM